MNRLCHRLTLRAVLPVAAVFLVWDLLAVRAGWWWFDDRQMLGVVLPGEACVHHLFEAQVDRAPTRPAIFSGTRSWSYGELEAVANRVAYNI